MYQEVKIGLAFLFGVGTGVYSTRTFFKLRYEKIANEEIESCKEVLTYRSGHIIEETSIESPEKFAEQLNELTNSDNGDLKLYSSIDNMFTAGKSEKKETKSHIDKLVEKEHPEDDTPDDCYEITEEDYSETALGYDKLTLHYYAEDDMLVNADDGDWTNTELGAEAYELIRSTSNKQLYFRNDPGAKDYEVIHMEGAYYLEM